MSTDYENMSDEDFANLNAPEGGTLEDNSSEDPDIQAESSDSIEPADPEETDRSSPDGTLEGSLDAAYEKQAAEVPTEEEPAEAGSKEPEGEPDSEAASEEDPATPKQTEAEKEPDAEEPGSDDPDKAEAKTDESEPESTESENTELSPEDAYKRIMAPFKANGKEFTPKSPDEVVRLMQQGANYAKKMQTLRPNLRMMKMLENNKLLDEDKLNFLIDLDKRNPAAIQKLLHDSKIDPLDIDTSEAPKYQPSNHSVSDAQYQFQETLNDITSNEGGQETVQTINQTWDKTSKEEVFKDPKILNLIQEQRENGIYSRITDELDRQKLLGNFEDTPFIYAYKAVGDYLHERGELMPASESSPAAQTKPREMLETRTAVPKPTLANDDRAQATSPARSSAAPAKKSFDPFTMTDEEIMALSSPSS